ncbi:hypothetical protein QJS10_CPB13g01687 [Acorus calamus]|uniref:Uncharacterized protein n=1 Tax=Acorus calamus TaxID=4465 RepID=A0AAV9DHR7_ACOCL|nr:hypothetical protein QJS10_CPB13g01687 [Acorus calamus]
MKKESKTLQKDNFPEKGNNIKPSEVSKHYTSGAPVRHPVPPIVHPMVKTSKSTAMVSTKSAPQQSRDVAQEQSNALVLVQKAVTRASKKRGFEIQTEEMTDWDSGEREDIQVKGSWAQSRAMELFNQSWNTSNTASQKECLMLPALPSPMECSTSTDPAPPARNGGSSSF